MKDFLKVPKLMALALMASFAMMMVAPFAAHAQDATATPAATAPVDPVVTLTTQVLKAITDIGGLDTVGKIALIVTILVSSTKVSFLKTLVWDKLGAAQAWVAPLLGLLAGILSQGSSLTLATALAYVASGAGALVLHELLDTVKAIPGLGSLWVSVIGVIEGALGGGSSGK